MVMKFFFKLIIRLLIGLPDAERRRAEPKSNADESIMARS